MAGLQQALVLLGFSVTVDGIPGPETEGAIRAFQQKHNLPATGSVDPATESAIAGDFMCVPWTPEDFILEMWS